MTMPALLKHFQINDFNSVYLLLFRQKQYFRIASGVLWLTEKFNVHETPI